MRSERQALGDSLETEVRSRSIGACGQILAAYGLRARCGPRDQGEPVITIMRLGED